MKFIIADDTVENLDAAKEAAKQFPEHEFVFTTSAKEAAVLLSSVDGVITDLFFPPEDHQNGASPLCYPYNMFSIETSKAAIGPAFDEVVREYYKFDKGRAIESFKDAHDLIEDGTIRGALERLVKALEARMSFNTDKYRERLKNLPAPQFPYGAALMLVAKRTGKRHVLVSDIHRHAGEFTSASGALDAMVLLIALVAKGIMTVKQATYDGEDSLTYIGADRLYELAPGTKPRKPRKTNPAVWAEAIRMAVSQST